MNWMDLNYNQLEIYIKFLEKRAKAAPEGSFVEIITEDEVITSDDD